MATTWRVLMGLSMCSLVFGAIGMERSALGGGMLCSIRFGAATDKTIAALRDRGPEGLDEALRAYDWLQQELEGLQNKLNQFSAAGYEGKKESIASVEREIAEMKLQMDRMSAAIDQIGGQRSCTVSRLYWYTNLEQAKAAAAETGRPILSLRMLGKLTDEYSCANSRFFRTALYSNKAVSDFLRTNFILHWQSVRPVPRVTIDFGDGRKLERTLTGNSAHYVLASDGTPLDVLPGLYSPLAFRQWTWTMRDFHDKYLTAPAADRSSMLQAFHTRQKNAILRRWDLDIQRLGEQRAELALMRITSAMEAARLAGQEVRAAGPAPQAVAASKRAVGRMRAEAPVLRFANLGGTWMERGMDDDLWKAIAALHREDVKLDEPSVALMRREAPLAADAALRAVSKSVQEDPILRVVRLFEDSMTLDTVRSEYLLHRRIHEQFAEDDAATADVNTLNEWVYSELFLTPSSDPWLGLAPRDVYTALENDGRVEPTTEIASRPGG